MQFQLRDLRLHGMIRTWQALSETRRLHELTLSEGMEVLLQAEADDRDGKRFERLQQNANFRYRASIEELNMDAKRGLDKAAVAIFATVSIYPKEKQY